MARLPGRAAVRISVTYVAVAAAWILASDRALYLLVSHEQAAWLQTIKGWAFVLVTGVLLYLLIRKELQRVTRSEEAAWHTARALEVTNQTLRTLADASPAAVVVIDPDGTVRKWSRAAERIFGWSEAEILGRPLPFIPEEGTDEHLGLRARLLEGKEVVETELRRERKDGSSIDVLLNAAPLRNETGNVTGIIGVLMDITERKRAEGELHQAEAKYRTLVEQLPALVYVARFGPTGDWLYVSPQVQAVFGFTPQEWLAGPHPLAACLHPEDQERVLSEERRCEAAGEAFHCEFRVRSRDGRTLWVRDDAIPVPGAPELWQGVMFDITEHKRAEEMLRSTIATLRQTDEERRRLLSRLVEANEEARRKMAADVHDGPIQKVVAAGLRLQMLRQRLRDPKDLEVLGETLRVVDGATKELRHLLFELMPPSLASGGLADALRQLLHELAEETGLDARLQESLHGDVEEPTRIGCYRITQEALHNVRKHAEASSVEVILESLDGGVQVSVTDDGCGFDAGGPELPGHFGLAGMRERAESAGGWLRIHSTRGEGTKVEFWLPQDAHLAA